MPPPTRPFVFRQELPGMRGDGNEPAFVLITKCFSKEKNILKSINSISYNHSHKLNIIREVLQDDVFLVNGLCKRSFITRV